VPPSFIAFYVELAMASSQQRTPGEECYMLVQGKKDEGRLQHFIPDVCFYYLFYKLGSVPQGLIYHWSGLAIAILASS
jgi:hypothetical protein